MTTRNVFRIFILSFFGLLALGVVSQSALGQAVNGTLLGTVTDSSGATVAGAKVKASATSTGLVHQTTTNESGNYTFPDMQPGPYNITVEATGFKKSTQEKIDLASNSSTRIDVAMQPGNVSETVLVTEAPPLLQTDRADISTKIESEAVVDMPLGTNRNFQTLINLVPGAAPATFQHSQFFNAASSLQTEVNGLPRQGNLYQIEGIDDDERTGLLQIIIPPAEAIASVDISTNNFEAELGRATGAVTNVTLKSGTNNLHGSLFEFIQNNDLNARSYFSTKSLGHLSYNYFGGSLGGPIIKDKLFIFGDYLHTSDHESVSSTFTIPDLRFFTPSATPLPGCNDPAGCIDLSAAMNGTKGQIFDPTAYSDGIVHDGSKNDPRPAFQNNQLPYSLVQGSVPLAALQALVAGAAKFGTLNSTKPMNNPANNYATNLPFTKTTDSFDIKSDYALAEKDHLSFRYSYQKAVTFQAAAFGSFVGGPQGGGFEGTGNQKSYSTGINFDHVFSPTFLTEVRIGVAHLGNSALPIDYGSNDATTLGVPGVNIEGQPFTSGQVAITINGGFSNPLIGYSASVPWIRAESNVDFVNNWTDVQGNHTFKWGIDVRRVHDDLLQDQTFSPRGAYTFSDVQTSNFYSPGTTTANPGTTIANDIASFLLQQPSQAGRDLNTFFPRYRQWWIFAFASDKWQASSKLTLDLGLRWDIYPPATPAVNGGFSNYDPVNNQLVLAGLGGNPKNMGQKNQYQYFAPRTGFAYRIRNSTVIRGGFGISYTPFPDNTYAYNYPIRANNSYQPTGTSGFAPAVLADGVTVATFDAGFPAPVPVTIPSNGIIPANTPFLTNQVYTYIPKVYHNPYASSWNLVVQQALPFDMSAQVAYVANHGTNISGSQNINLPSTFGGGANSDPEKIAFGRTAATNQFFLGFSSNYESLQASLQKRFSHGLALTSAFTWGKGLGYISGDDGGLTFFINWRRNYAPNDYDRKYNYEQSFTYELPFGRGHQMLNSAVGDAVLGGWKLSGIVSVLSGLPFTITGSNGSLATPGTQQTALLVKKFKKLGGIGTSPWFENSIVTPATPDATWAQPSGCTATPCTNPGLGNTGRNQFRGPGYLQDNFSVFKRFALYRETGLEVRVDAFQLSNTPQFGLPNGSCCGAASFGTVTTTLGSGQGSVNGVGGGRTLQGSAKFSF